MNILFVGPEAEPLLHWLRECEDCVLQTDQKINIDYLNNNEIHFIVSYGYRHKITQDVLDFVGGRAVNLHISYLPWNKGADPNFWSFLEDTPKGVTIHYIDAGFDTGDIIAQKLIEFDVALETLASSYAILSSEIRILFKENWGLIKKGGCSRMKQQIGGSLHRTRDKEQLAWLLINGWNTPVSLLLEYGRNNKSTV